MPNPLNDLSVLSIPLALMDLTIVVRGNTRGARSFQQGFNQFCSVLLGVTGADVVFASSIVVQIPDFEEDVQFRAYICAHSIFYDEYRLSARDSTGSIYGPIHLFIGRVL